MAPMRSLMNAFLLTCLGASLGEAGLVAPRQANGPSFFPPPSADNSAVIRCDYPEMNNWQYGGGTSKKDWLKWVGAGRAPAPGVYDIETDYDAYTPKGVVRTYSMSIASGSVTLDGHPFTDAKLFNNKYPGPWIQACWGDTIEIFVTNDLQYNGTAVHWHGFRMLNELLMDGVPGVTQCPIPPGETFVYRFRARQYGSSWYHSHYSLQYTDGLFGPITIHGPSSDEYDESIDPLLMTDHVHKSAFELYKPGGGPVTMESQLINGKGLHKTETTGTRYSTVVQKSKKYLLRLINASTDATWVFSIDDHKFTVVGSDFVAVQPYERDQLAIGIGQRYHVILETKDDAEPGDAFWIRLNATNNCNAFRGGKPDDRTGILYYGSNTGALPTTDRVPGFNISCRDEPFENLVPVVEWTVPDPNIDAAKFEKAFELDLGNFVPPDRGSESIAGWAINSTTSQSPMWLNYSRPIVKHLNEPFPKTWVVHSADDYKQGNWIYLMMASGNIPGTSLLAPLPLFHPIHFHGHDFVLLQQSPLELTLENLDLKLDNPPRRDVVLLPGRGFIVIAFRADNPGSWLMHCHIAFHASGGLALQILEDKPAFQTYLQNSRDRPEMERICEAWDMWYNDPNNHYPDQEHFQDDSGI
ncbi:hypothetical protein FQN57_002941 [Myotisia sp. PD_48]|nr:hypothetical protein FQN57_002941 [Myotisia sp. PD_48]